jgi:metallo-beta-lactamase family protein
METVVLTHAYIDGSGLLARLERASFAGSIFATRRPTDLCFVVLPDSAHVQEMEVQQFNRRSRWRGRAEAEPLYTRDWQRGFESGSPYGRTSSSW